MTSKSKETRSFHPHSDGAIFVTAIFPAFYQIVLSISNRTKQRNIGTLTTFLLSLLVSGAAAEGSAARSTTAGCAKTWSMIFYLKVQAIPQNMWGKSHIVCTDDMQWGYVSSNGELTNMQAKHARVVTCKERRDMYSRSMLTSPKLRSRGYCYGLR